LTVSCLCSDITRTIEPCQFTCRNCLDRKRAESKPAPKLCAPCAKTLKVCPNCECPNE
jgi:hypothetical protein